MSMKSSVLVCLASLAAGLSALAAGTTTTRGDAYGVVEIGASGIKGQVVRSMGNTADGPPTELVKEYAPVEANAFKLTAPESDGIKTVVNQIRNGMKQEFHVPADRIYLVGSSGLPDEAKAVLSGIDFGATKKIEFVTPEQESVFLFRGTVSSERAPNVVSLDIGSGNSKGAYLEQSSPRLTFASFAIPWGTKTAAHYIDQNRNSSDFLAAAEDFRVKRIVSAIRSQTEQYPGMQNRRYLYLSGGIIWAMETLLHPFQEEVLQKVTIDDINTFCEKATANAKALLNPDLDALIKSNPSVPHAAIEKARTEISRVSNVFTEDQIVAGSLIVKTFATEMRWSQKDGIFFARSALNAWPRGYLVQMIQPAGGSEK
jgi:hypothetical protein